MEKGRQQHNCGYATREKRLFKVFGATKEAEQKTMLITFAVR